MDSVSTVLKKLNLKGIENDGGLGYRSIRNGPFKFNTLRSIELLDHFGVEAQYGIGNSLGEIAALSWAGVMDGEDAVAVANARGDAMSRLGEKGGAMLALRCDETMVHQLIEGKEVWITGYNGQGSYVVGGAVAAVAEVQEAAFEVGVKNVSLKVSHAFHTPMMKRAAKQFKQSLKDWDFTSVERNIISTITGKRLDASADIANLLYRQIEDPVQFTQAIEAIKEEVGVLIEVGPGRSLTRSLGSYEEFDKVALDFGSPSIQGLMNVLSAAYVNGGDIQFDELAHNRFYRTFDLDKWQLEVLESPCEKVQLESSMIRKMIEAQPAEAQNGHGTAKKIAAPVQASSEESVLSYLKNLISEKTEIPVEVITGEDKIMSQLHLNSLAITEIISLATKAFNKSHKVFSAASILANSDSSIAEISQLIYKGSSGNTAKNDKAGVSFELAENWTHLFSRKSVAKKASKIKVNRGAGKIIVRGLPAIAMKWEETLAKIPHQLGDGAIFIYKSEQGQAALYDFVQFLNQDAVRQGKFVALVNLRTAALNTDLRPVLRTFQQEAPQISSFSLELSAGIKEPLDLLIKELKVASKYKEVIYNDQGERLESECQVFFPQAGDLNQQIAKGDVILATGGGKGITFASVFELALNTGAKLAILGRSQPAQSEELKTNLQLLESNNIEYGYYAADVCNPTAIDQALNQINSELGPVRVLIHGAGINKPKPLSLLSQEDFEHTQRVKLEGLRHVMEALDQNALRLLIGYGSIIAESGMQGNADYAWANDQLAIYIGQLNKELKHCRCLTLEWSVWDETGMGVSLNSLDSLKEKGVWPIPVKNGVDILKAVIADSNSQEERLIVSGRFGDIPTLLYTKKRLPIGRFISKIKHQVPGVEIVSDVSVNLKDDVYLKNHVFQNQYVFPTVMILEGIAQVCNAIQGAEDAWVFDDLQIHKSIFVPKEGNNTVRFIVTRLSADQFKAVVQSEDSNFEVNCFEAIVNYQARPDFKAKQKAIKNGQAIDLDVSQKFYDDLLFHHGPFRRVQSFYHINALESLAGAQTSLNDKWFGPYIPDQCLLGDAGLNDAAIHCHQACRPGWNLLPTGASQIAFNTAEVAGPLYIKTIETREVGNDTIIDVCVLNKAGVVKQYWTDLVLTKVTGTDFSGQWDPHLLVNHIEYQLRGMTKQSNILLPDNERTKLLKALQEGKSTELFQIEGCGIRLSAKTPSEVEADGSVQWGEDATADDTQLFMELEMANQEEALLLQIAQLNTVD